MTISSLFAAGVERPGYRVVGPTDLSPPKTRAIMASVWSAKVAENGRKWQGFDYSSSVQAARK